MELGIEKKSRLSVLLTVERMRYRIGRTGGASVLFTSIAIRKGLAQVSRLHCDKDDIGSERRSGQRRNPYTLPAAGERRSESQIIAAYFSPTAPRPMRRKRLVVLVGQKTCTGDGSQGQANGAPLLEARGMATRHTSVAR